MEICSWISCLGIVITIVLSVIILFKLNKTEKYSDGQTADWMLVLNGVDSDGFGASMASVPVRATLRGDKWYATEKYSGKEMWFTNLLSGGKGFIYLPDGDEGKPITLPTYQVGHQIRWIMTKNGKKYYRSLVPLDEYLDRAIPAGCTASCTDF